jgi:5-methylcytosine-specific restriction endonuclease McrA
VPSQYYTRQQLFDRDGYDCYLCNLPVELTANHIVGQPGWELYPHIDHVIPLALGGHDTLDNVKITHAKCNMVKGATAPVAV